MKYDSNTKEYTYSRGERIVATFLATYLILAILSLAIPGSLLQMIIAGITGIAGVVLGVAVLATLGKIIFTGRTK